MKKYTGSICLCVALACLPLALHAQQGEQKLPDQLSLNQVRTLELSAGGQSLTAGYANWRQLTLRGTYDTGNHVLQGELAAKKEFGESGNFIGLSDTLTIAPDLYANVSVGAGDGAFYLPRYRVDGSINKKWLAKQNLVTSLGLGYYKAPDGHIDHGLGLSAAYYFDAPLIVEGGVRFNRSSPGAVVTHQQFVAATLGRDKHDLFSARFAWGGEGYLTIAQNTALVDFHSKELNLMWRHWIGPRSGFLVDLNHYRNPFYERSGFNVGVFRQFE